MEVFKMIVLLCSLSAGSYDNCSEANAIAVDRLTRVAPYAGRCWHDSQHEQAQLLYRDQIKWTTAHLTDKAPYPLTERKIKVLCIPETNPAKAAGQ